MRQTKLETARGLARKHFKIEPDITRIFLLEAQDENDKSEPIKLLEVVEGALERGIDPVIFPSNPGLGINYPTMIVEVSPREFKDIYGEPLKFEGQTWTIGEELHAR